MSGLFDMTLVQKIADNDALKLTDDEVSALSPLFLAPRIAAAFSHVNVSKYLRISMLDHVGCSL